MVFIAWLFSKRVSLVNSSHPQPFWPQRVGFSSWFQGLASHNLKAFPRPPGGSGTRWHAAVGSWSPKMGGWTSQKAGSSVDAWANSQGEPYPKNRIERMIYINVGTLILIAGYKPTSIFLLLVCVVSAKSLYSTVSCTGGMYPATWCVYFLEKWSALDALGLMPQLFTQFVIIPISLLVMDIQ